MEFVGKGEIWIPGDADFKRKALIKNVLPILERVNFGMSKTWTLGLKE